LDGSSQDQTVKVDYTYDSVGKVAGASGAGSFTSDDGFGNKTSGSISQTYTVIKGQAKMAASTTNSKTANLDGSSQDQTVKVDYAYDSVGKVAGASGAGNFTSDDGFG